VVDDFVGRVGNDSRITGCKDGIKGYGVIGQGELLCQCP
jgi:hypothetical protein